MENQTSVRQLFTVAEFVKQPEFSYLTQSAVRYLIFKSQPRFTAGGEEIPTNGLVEAGALVRIGRKVLISASEFRAWTLAQREISLSSPQSNQVMEASND